MSEYWKSTPKYWCKHCKTYVRDTKFEKEQHEATGKHKYNVSRSIRDHHKENEKNAREKQRAKDEVARLNGIVSGSTASSSTANNEPSKQKLASSASSAPKQATLEERKRQVAQLAEMGIEVPEEFRKDMALAGGWQTISETVVNTGVKKESGDDFETENHGTGRKRKLALQEDEDEEMGGTASRRNWGATFKYPGSKSAEDELDALLTATKKPEPDTIKSEPLIKKEEPEDGSLEQDAPVESNTSEKEAAASTDSPTPGGIVFKKRKNKAVRPT